MADDPLFAVRNLEQRQVALAVAQPVGLRARQPDAALLGQERDDRWPQVAGGEHLMVWSDESDRDG
jgi:hypothetical protein